MGRFLTTNFEIFVEKIIKLYPYRRIVRMIRNFQVQSVFQQNFSSDNPLSGQLSRSRGDVFLLFLQFFPETGSPHVVEEICNRPPIAPIRGCHVIQLLLLRRAAFLPRAERQSALHVHHDLFWYFPVFPLHRLLFQKLPEKATEREKRQKEKRRD